MNLLYQHVIFVFTFQYFVLHTFLCHRDEFVESRKIIQIVPFTKQIPTFLDISCVSFCWAFIFARYSSVWCDVCLGHKKESICIEMDRLADNSFWKSASSQTLKDCCFRIRSSSVVVRGLSLDRVYIVFLFRFLLRKFPAPTMPLPLDFWWKTRLRILKFKQIWSMRIFLSAGHARLWVSRKKTPKNFFHGLTSRSHNAKPYNKNTRQHPQRQTQKTQTKHRRSDGHRTDKSQT